MLPSLGMSPVGTGTFSTSASQAAGSAATSSATSAAAGAVEGAGQDFSAVLGRVAEDASTTLKSAEATAIQGVQGQATTKSVVEAMMAAERTLQTAVAVRDKAVSAYQEVSRMQI